MTVLALYAAHDSPGKHDSSGAFEPEARRLVAMRGGEAIPIDNTASMRARLHHTATVLATETRTTLPPRHDSLALFCHGWSSGIQLGPRLRWGKARTRDVDALAQAIRAGMGDAPTVVLYACSTGTWWRRSAPGGDGGFADELRDALCRAGATGCVVYAHSTEGHATRNPYLRRFAGEGSGVGGTGGQWVIEPWSELWPAWCRALREGDLRFRFPWMPIAELEAELIAQSR